MRKSIKNGSIKYSLCLLSLLFAFIFVPNIYGNCRTASAEGKAEAVMELSTGTVIHEKNASMRMPMASTTKIMTALIVIEECELDQELTVADEAVGVEGSSIYLKSGEMINVRDLLYGLMLRSGNDSATALAIHHSGSIEKFVRRMNDKAAELGLTHTHFANPSGLHDENHYTTAGELCKLACTAMKNPVFKEIVGTKSYNGKFRSYINKNKLLHSLDGANGVKTGYTIKAGRCLVSSAERNGMDVICVVLNCPDMYQRSIQLIEDCFSTYKLEKLNKDTVFMSDIIPCKLDKDYTLLVKQGQNLEYIVKPVELKRKIKCGEMVGELKIYSQNDLIFCGNLYSIISK